MPMGDWKHHNSEMQSQNQNKKSFMRQFVPQKINYYTGMYVIFINVFRFARIEMLVS